MAIQLDRLADVLTDGDHAGIAFQRTRHGRHVGVCHRRGPGWRLLHLAFDHLLVDEELRSDSFVIARFEVDSETARDFCGFCRRIARAHPRIPYAIGFNPEVSFTPQGHLSRPFDLGRGLNCSTFVLTVFASFGVELVDLASWQERLSDVDDHVLLIRFLQGWPTVTQEHLNLVMGDVGCCRVRPEECAGACLVEPLPAAFREAVDAGIAVLDYYDVRFPPAL